MAQVQILDVVRILKPVKNDWSPETIQEGETGTVVWVNEMGKSYYVEFSEGRMSDIENEDLELVHAHPR